MHVMPAADEFGDPSRISELLDYTPPVRPPKLVLTDIAVTDAPDAYMRSLHPKHEQFEKLRQLLLKLRRSDGSKEEVKLPADNKDKWIVYVENLQEAGPQDLNGQPKPESASAGIERILINMERWRWLPEDLGKLHVWDNVPECADTRPQGRQDHSQRQDHRRPAVVADAVVLGGNEATSSSIRPGVCPTASS